MPALAFLAVVGLALVALLFVADATLESGSPPIVTSTRVGLPEPWHPNTAGALTTTPAPAPDMSSKAVPSAQPSEASAKIDPAARAARAEAPARKPARSSRSAPMATTSGITRPPTCPTDFPPEATRANTPDGASWLLNQFGAKAREFLAGDRP